MGYRAIDHVALRVTDLRAAEAYYRRLFGLKVAFREAVAQDGWRTLPPGVGWDEAERAGIELGLVFLSRGPFRLALEGTEAALEGGRLAHICLDADPKELDALRERAMEMGCRVMLDRPGYLIFADAFGVHWEVTGGHVLRSNGEGLGRWLGVAPESEQQD